VPLLYNAVISSAERARSHREKLLMYPGHVQGHVLFPCLPNKNRLVVSTVPIPFQVEATVSDSVVLLTVIVRVPVDSSQVTQTKYQVDSDRLTAPMTQFEYLSIWVVPIRNTTVIHSRNLIARQRLVPHGPVAHFSVERPHPICCTSRESSKR